MPGKLRPLLLGFGTSMLLIAPAVCAGPAVARGTAPGAHLSSLGVIDPTAVGTRTNGRVFATAPGAAGYTCSGTALRTPSRSVVLTAGHCIVEGGAWARRLRFIPAFDHGHRPFGTFHARAVRVMEGWRLSQNANYDVGAIIVNPNDRGHLGDVVGTRRWVIGRSRFARFQIFGYPDAALAGQQLRACVGLGLGPDPHSDPGPPAVASRCDMAAGASGGGWLLDRRYLNGVTSYGYPNGTRLFSPYFGPAVGAFLSRLP